MLTASNMLASTALDRMITLTFSSNFDLLSSLVVLLVPGPVLPECPDSVRTAFSLGELVLAVADVTWVIDVKVDPPGF